MGSGLPRLNHFMEHAACYNILSDYNLVILLSSDKVSLDIWPFPSSLLPVQIVSCLYQQVS